MLLGKFPLIFSLNCSPLKQKKKKIHVFRPAVLALLEGETGKTWHQYINNTRTALASSSRCKGGWKAISTVGCWCRSRQPCAVPPPGRTGKKSFKMCSTEGTDLLPEVTEEPDCPPACLPKGSQVKGMVLLYWAKEVNLHSPNTLNHSILHCRSRQALLLGQ